MAITYPLSLATLAEKLKISNVVWDIQRNDQFSGSGNGMFWQAELAPPLWTAQVTLTNLLPDDGLEVAAIIRKLHGAAESFWLYDPQRIYPKLDPDGTILGASTVLVNSVPSNKNVITLKGLPAGYSLSVGDKIQIVNGVSGKSTFLEVSQAINANGSGVTGQMEVFPRVPAWVVANDSVTLKKAACLMRIMPGSHNPGSADQVVNTGASFKTIQRKTP